MFAQSIAGAEVVFFFILPSWVGLAPQEKHPPTPIDGLGFGGSGGDGGYFRSILGFSMANRYAVLQHNDRSWLTNVNRFVMVLLKFIYLC